MPSCVLEDVDQASFDIPSGETWVFMTKPELQEYINKMRIKSEKIMLVPNTNNIGPMSSQIISGLNATELNLLKNTMKRQFGDMLKAKMVDMLGARNVSLNKSSAYVISMSSTLINIGNLMSGGALKTTIGGLNSMKAGFSEHGDIFEYGVASLKSFLISIEDM